MVIRLQLARNPLLDKEALRVACVHEGRNARFLNENLCSCHPNPGEIRL